MMRIEGKQFAIPLGLVGAGLGFVGAERLTATTFHNDFYASPYQRVEQDQQGNIVRKRPAAGNVVEFMAIGAGALVSGSGTALLGTHRDSLVLRALQSGGGGLLCGAGVGAIAGALTAASLYTGGELHRAPR